ncbi:MAG: hypothetical protein HYT40_01145 [Candidatus Sungbacteria bacterium]|uniref:Uncharacterized protein n=1 Tax=Candidatus Sungiibacteriota bacterium TaxID=2750080 RepID=A0A931WNX9_9BACT|nr:hypothetical protein [Candidatus Sungbacteria bacterium]
MIVIIIVLSAWGCTSQPAEEAPKAETPKLAVAAPAVQEDVQAGEKQREQRREMYLAETRGRDIAVAKEAIARFSGHGSDWAAVVKGGVYGPSADLCSQIEALLELRSSVFGRLDVQHEDRLPISWQEIGIERVELWKEFAAASKKAAATLFTVYRRPHADRNADCGRGEGSWRFDDPGEVMQRLLWVMEGAKLSPADIGTTANAMRTALVTDYRAYIALYRGMIARGEASGSDGGGAIISAVRDAEQLWEIPRSQLGLTAGEKQILPER